MTLQEIADYAMDYLDSKGIAAEYEITSGAVKIFFNDRLFWFYEGEPKAEMERWIETAI